MKTLIWLTTGATLGIAAYVLFNGANRSAFASGSVADDLEDASDDLRSSARSWGAGQRLTGTAGSLGGRLKEGFGDLTGNDALAGEGVADQAIGGAKDVAGKAANAVSNAVDKLT